MINYLKNSSGKKKKNYLKEFALDANACGEGFNEVFLATSLVGFLIELDFSEPLSYYWESLFG